jgi:hypothetical protein
MSYILTNWRLLLTGLSILVILLMGFYVNHLKITNKKLGQEIEASRGLVCSLSDSLNRTHEALIERSGHLKRITEEKLEIQEKLEAIYASDPEARDWSNCRMPDSIIDQLRRKKPSP